MLAFFGSLLHGDRTVLRYGQLLIAAGFIGSGENVTSAFGVETDSRSNVASKDGTHKTNVEKVFTAGDMHIGQSLVVRAIREGRDAAAEVDKYLMGYTNIG